MKRIIAVLAAVCLIALTAAGCSGSEEKLDMIYPFGGDVNSFDPQVASTQDEFLIIENCFEGLVRCDDEGNITPGCAESWNVSGGGTVYTFNLKQGLKWHIYESVAERMGENFDPEITAQDFVFALQRAASDTTDSPLYSTIASIAGAPEVHSGEKDESTLGVTASGSYTLTITLSAPDESFLQTMSTAVAMPCNREFFEATNGRYGLDLEYTMFNGQFLITNVLDASYILKANEDYAGPSPTAVTDLTLKISQGDEDVSEELLSGYYDAAYIRGYESSGIDEKSGVTLTPYSNITWMLVVNGSNGLFAAPDARRALFLSLSDTKSEEFPYLTRAIGYVPPTCTVNGERYSGSHSVAEAPDAAKATELWKKTVSAQEIYSQESVLIVPDYMEDAARQLVQGVQAAIGSVSSVDSHSVSFSVVIEPLPESEVRTRLATGSYDLALYPFGADSASPLAFLQSVADAGYASLDEDFEKALEKAANESGSNAAESYAECEKELYSNYIYLPVFYEDCYYAQASGVSGVQFHPGSGRVSFINATRE